MVIDVVPEGERGPQVEERLAPPKLPFSGARLCELCHAGLCALCRLGIQPRVG